MQRAQVVNPRCRRCDPAAVPQPAIPQLACASFLFFFLLPFEVEFQVALFLKAASPDRRRS